MPLRDHFHPPLSKRRGWDGLHGMWPSYIATALNRVLPQRYVAEPRIHWGASFEIDVGATEEDLEGGKPGSTNAASAGGIATAVWAPPRPTLAAPADPPAYDEYEVRVLDADQPTRLVAAVEIVSPGNKDRPESRRSFVAKCEELLRRGVAVMIVDLVTSRDFNLYGELLAMIGQSDPALSPDPPRIYAAACRWHQQVPPDWREGRTWQFEAWAHTLTVGDVLPTLPLWLSADLAVPLELEATYEESCRALRIQ